MMAVNTTALSEAVRRYDRRVRMGQTLMSLPRAWAVGLLVGVIAAVASRLRPLLLPQGVLIVAGAALILATGVAVALIWLRRVDVIASARRLDQALGLRDRISTALELTSGRIHAGHELAALQIDDALRAASAADARAAAPFSFSRRDGLIALALAGVLALLLFLPNPQVDALTDAAADQAAVAAAAEEISEITEAVARDPDLTETDRQSLLQSLDASREVLTQTDVTPEEAFAALSEAQSQLQERSDDLTAQSQAMQQALQNAASRLSAVAGMRANDSASTSLGESGQDVQEMLDQLGEQMDAMDEAARQAAADAMNQAANSMQGQNPQAAQSMRDGAQQLQQGNTQAAQQQAQQAGDQAAQAGQQAQQQQNAAESLDQAAQQAEAAAQNLDPQNQDGSPQRQPQDSQSGEQNDQSSQSEASSDQSEPGQSSSQQGESQSGQPNAEPEGSQPGAQGSESQPGESDQAGEGGQDGGEPQAPRESSADQSSGASGSGDSANPDAVQSNAEANQAPSTDNDADGQGVGDDPPIYAPDRIGGETGDNTIILEPDNGESPSIEGDFSENPAGQSSRPYTQVFGDYRAAANRALESGYVPLGLRDVVRQYFSSLEP